MNRLAFGAALALVPAMLTAAAIPAEAKIQCSKGYQNVAGSMIATPYCQDNYVGAVAREYGLKVSDAAIRENPNLKRHVCQLVGRDIRIYQTCIDANAVGGRRGP